MKKYLLLLLSIAAFSQNPTAFPNGIRTKSIIPYPTGLPAIGINTTNPQAALDVVSTVSGVLDPRVTEAQRDAITVGAAQNGMRVFVTDAATPGFQYYDHPTASWKSIGGSAGIAEVLSVNPIANENQFALFPAVVGGYDHETSISGSEISVTSSQLGSTLMKIGSVSVTENDLPGIFSASKIDIGANRIIKIRFDEFGVPSDFSFTQNFPDALLGNINWEHPSTIGNFKYASETFVENAIEEIGGGSTNLSYTASPTNGIVNSDTGTDATLTLVDGTNAGLQRPSDYTALNSAKAVNGLVVGNGSGSFSAAASGTNVKTVNGTSILGSGNIVTGTGDVVGPASSTDNTIARFDSTTGKLIQGSTAAITDLGELVLPSSSAPTYANGKLAYDSDNDALTFFNSNNNVALQVGQEQWIRVRNVSGSTIANGSAVYINGSNSGLPTIALAQANSGTTTVCAGIATQSIPNNSVGFITSIGAVRNLNTSSFVVGAVYLSATTPGALTQTIPSAPAFRYRVGFVTTVNATTGTIHVTPSTAALANGTTGQLLRIGSGGSQEFFTPNYAEAPSVAKLTTDYNLPSVASNTPNKLFNVGTSGNGAFTLPTGEYRIEMEITMSGLPSGATIMSFVQGGTAVLSGMAINVIAAKSTGDLTLTNGSSLVITSPSVSAITASNTSTFLRFVASGSFSVTTAGTYIPQIQCTGAMTTAVSRAGNSCVIRRLGALGFTATADVD